MREKGVFINEQTDLFTYKWSHQVGVTLARVRTYYCGYSPALASPTLCLRGLGTSPMRQDDA
jgi:hypothetical protein